MENTTVVYYIGETQLTDHEFIEQAKYLPGCIESIWDTNNKELTISFVSSKIKGMGTYLLTTVFTEANTEGIYVIKLDDMSDRFGKPHNIYKKLGLEYIEEGYPEMIGKTKNKY